ncbi:NAD(P)-binding protein [Novosphingobium sp. 1Y9A]|uniref:NAD(P)-binding protein n=1 Tax=Novosphingobium jiangmenense TaxID=2791981 RepID=A0ABS0HBY0_9SPHN|nr:NAD(P)-binding protein [Novosphingobium jiangmenense]
MSATNSPRTANLPITDRESLKAALRDANLPTLLMVYSTWAQDRAYLDSFAPYLTAAYAADAPSDVPEAMAQDLRDRLFALLTSPIPPEEKPLDTEFLRHMMSVSVGEDVDPGLIPVLYDQMGFEPPVARKHISGRPTPPKDFDVLVIGGGMSGIAAGIKLSEAGYSYTIVEKNAELGGTWWENRYPGVGGRHAQPLLQLLVRTEPRMEPLPSQGAGNSGLPRGRGRQARCAQPCPVRDPRHRRGVGRRRCQVARQAAAQGRHHQREGRQRRAPRPWRPQPLVHAEDSGPRNLCRAQDAHRRMGHLGRSQGQARCGDRHRRQRRAARPGDCRRSLAPDDLPAFQALGAQQPGHQRQRQRQRPLRPARDPPLQGMVPLPRLLVLGRRTLWQRQDGGRLAEPGGLDQRAERCRAQLRAALYPHQAGQPPRPRRENRPRLSHLRQAHRARCRWRLARYAGQAQRHAGNARHRPYREGRDRPE